MILVVGAGFSGSVIARECAEAGRKVLILEKRDHIGGNAFDKYDKAGILIHKYGPHIFHTNSQRIVNFLSQFTEWRPYEHRVLSVVNGEKYPFPINLITLNKLYNLNLDEDGALNFLEAAREKRDEIKNSEDVVLHSVGRDLYEKFFLNYTRKQWGVDPKRLKASVAARIPFRTNSDDRYFTDKFQIMPAKGYTEMFKSMLNHPLIELHLNMDYKSLSDLTCFEHVFYTGPIDSYFNYCYGALPYRSLRFDHQHLSDVGLYQETGTINFPNDFDYTRVTEFKHLTGQQHAGTSIVKEFPLAIGDPYYPIPSEENEKLFKMYEQLARKETRVTFVGRLAEYRYYNMDQAIGAALAAAKRFLG